MQDIVEGGPSFEINHSSVVLIEVGQNIVIKLLGWYLILWPLKILVIASDVVYVFDVMKCNIPNTSVSVFAWLCYFPNDIKSFVSRKKSSTTRRQWNAE